MIVSDKMVEAAAAALHDCKPQISNPRLGYHTFLWKDANPAWKANALKEMRIALEAALSTGQAAIPDGSQGRCETTLTPRFAYPDCKCGTYPDNQGPCMTFELGASETNCVFCDHKAPCHRSILEKALASLAPHPSPADARDAMIEECAEIADKLLWSTEWSMNSADKEPIAVHYHGDVAAAIRALTTHTSEPKP